MSLDEALAHLREWAVGVWEDEQAFLHEQYEEDMVARRNSEVLGMIDGMLGV